MRGRWRLTLKVYLNVERRELLLRVEKGEETDDKRKRESILYVGKGFHGRNTKTL